MRFEWDERKAERNSNFLDPSNITFFDLFSSEEREITIGHSALFRLLLVVHIERNKNTIRIISARKATKKERVKYEKRI